MLTIDLDKLNIQPGDYLLDLGCGEGRHSLGACLHNNRAHIVALDLNYNSLAVGRQQIKEFLQHGQYSIGFCQASGFNLPFANHSFDHIVCAEVLEHVKDYPLVLQEIYRTLKPGGSLSISVPRYWPERLCWALSSEYHNVPGGHVHIFKHRKLKQEILNKPYVFHRRSWAHALHVPYWWLRCAFWRRGETFYLARWYHKLLVWDLMKRPWLTQTLEKILNPLMGKSVVLYLSKSLEH